MRARKHAHDARSLDELFRALAAAGPVGALARGLADDPREFALAISNVPGPRVPVAVGGRRVGHVYTSSEPGPRHALRVAAISNDRWLGVGFLLRRSRRRSGCRAPRRRGARRVGGVARELVVIGRAAAARCRAGVSRQRSTAPATGPPPPRLEGKESHVVESRARAARGSRCRRGRGGDLPRDRLARLGRFPAAAGDERRARAEPRRTRVRAAGRTRDVVVATVGRGGAESRRCSTAS